MRLEYLGFNLQKDVGFEINKRKEVWMDEVKNGVGYFVIKK